MNNIYNWLLDRDEDVGAILGGFGVRVEKYIPSLEDMKEVEEEFPH